MNQKVVKISVREIIEYTMRSGDITSVSLSSARAVDGIKAHQKFQNNQGDNYESEVSVAMEIEDDIKLVLQGRIDGVLHHEDGGILIDEIKSTGGSVDEIQKPSEMHLAQAKMYGFMYGVSHDIEIMTIRMTYIELENFKIKQFEALHTLEELKIFFDGVILSYINWLKEIENWHTIRNESIYKSDFPFDTYRAGQKKLMSAVFKTVDERKRLFSRAPTGIGKTIATIFPALKSLAFDKTSKVFYLTAKTIGKEVAVDTLDLLEEQGLDIKRVVITAKDKICLNDVTKCNEKDCPYAKGHYDRVNFVIEEMFRKHNRFDRACIEEWSMKHQVCPYELSLDLALFSDVIICDYNYAFDPVSSLKRFFVEGNKDYTLLIDEAHNLVDRAREMYSSTLEKNHILAIKKKVKALDAKLYKYLNRVNKMLIQYRKECTVSQQGFIKEEECPYVMVDALRGAIYRTEKLFKAHKNWEHMDELLEFFFEAYDFVKKSETYDDSYITYYECDGQNVKAKLYCIDPSHNLQEATRELSGVIYFSATLLPLNYYVNILGGNKESYGLDLESPFLQKHLCLVVNQKISTKYKDRANAIAPIVKEIHGIVESNQGNYIAYFPSYKFMEEVYDYYTEVYRKPNYEVVLQERGLNEVEKEAFIQMFSIQRDQSLLVFSVLGGMFSEGIDLKGDLLCGSIIVGVGLPMIGVERNLIRDFYNERRMSGFDYAYLFPGMNKVLQAAGRVIRTMEDRGCVVLIDTRFNTRTYQRLFPKEWSHCQLLERSKATVDYLTDFW